MERYDGKTKKDDVKKYILIGLAVVLVILLYKGLTGIIYRVSHPTPDITVVFAAKTVTDHQEEDEMEALMKNYAVDLDGNGKVVVDVVPYDIRANAAMEQIEADAVGAEDGGDIFTSRITGGEGLIFITHDQSLLNHYFTEKYLTPLPEELAESDKPCRMDISGCKMLAEQGLGKVEFFAGIRKDASQEEYAAAVEILENLVD